MKIIIKISIAIAIIVGIIILIRYIRSKKIGTKDDVGFNTLNSKQCVDGKCPDHLNLFTSANGRCMCLTDKDYFRTQNFAHNQEAEFSK